jgi:hypothetical protein
MQADIDDLQSLCELGQQQLMQTEYLAAEATLAMAEGRAWAAHDWDTLARLYMPLQEARRQRRQRCGEGIVRLDLLAHGPGDSPDAQRIARSHPHGQLLIAGWGSIKPSVELRKIQADRGLYLETFLAAAYAVGGGLVVAIAPTVDIALPSPASLDSMDALARALPQCLVLPESDLPKGDRRGNTQTYAHIMSLWERLHTPALAAADAIADPIERMAGYRKTIEVDYACELAHQKLSDVARQLSQAARMNRK